MAKTFRLWPQFLFVTGAGLLLLGSRSASAAIHAGNGIDQPMYRHPRLPHPKTTETFNPAYRSLWRQALAGPSVQVRCHVCQALVQAGHTGFPGLTTFTKALENLASGGPEKSILRQSAVKALVAINHPSTAPALLQAEKLGGVNTDIFADAALARWYYRPAMASWISRLLNNQVETPVKISAINALLRVHDRTAISDLRQLVRNSTVDIRTRLAAAKALASLHAGGVAGMAQNLLAGPPHVGLNSELIAVFLVSGGHTAAQQKILTVLTRNQNLAVQVIAVRSLLRANWHDLLPDTQALAAARNSTLRLLAARLARREKNVPILNCLLNDPRRPVRWYARDALALLGRQPILSAPIEHGLMQLLKQNHPRQQRQAALALGVLHYQPAATALLTLLRDKSQPSVRLGALVALRRLAVSNTLPRLFIYARHDAAISRRMADPKMRIKPTAAKDFKSCGDELAQLLQLFGKTRYHPASLLLEQFIPKHSPYAVIARTAAVWALGKIHAGEKNSPLVALFQGRLSDQNLMDPEASTVRRMSAISLARLHSMASVSLLQGFFGEAPMGQVGLACRWAIGKLTGKTPAMPVVTVDFRSNFITPDYPTPQ